MANLATARARRTDRTVGHRVASDLRSEAGAGRPGALGAWLPAAIAAAAALAWEAAARAGVVGALYLPAPSAIARTLAGAVASGELALHLGATLTRVALALVFGGVPGLVLGLVLGWSPRARRVVDPVIAALHPMPKIAVLPLIMAVLGVGEISRVAVASLAVVFPIAINTMAGVRQVNPLYFEVARSYGARTLQLFTRVALPGSLPVILSGLRLALSIALLTTVAVEIIAADRGLGAMIWRAWEVMRIELLYAAMLVAALLGVGFNAVVQALSRRLVPWQSAGEPPAR